MPTEPFLALFAATVLLATLVGAWTMWNAIRRARRPDSFRGTGGTAFTVTPPLPPAASRARLAFEIAGLVISLAISAACAAWLVTILRF